MFSKISARTLLLPAFFSLLSPGLPQDSPESVQPPNKIFAKKVVISGLSNPWEITWGPDNKLWVTERTGKRITRVDPTSGQQKVAITIDYCTVGVHDSGHLMFFSDIYRFDRDLEAGKTPYPPAPVANLEQGVIVP